MEKRFEIMQKAIKEKRNMFFKAALKDKETAELVMNEIRAVIDVLKDAKIAPVSLLALSLMALELIYKADKKGIYEPQNVEGIEEKD